MYSKLHLILCALEIHNITLLKFPCQPLNLTRVFRQTFLWMIDWLIDFFMAHQHRKAISAKKRY